MVCKTPNTSELTRSCILAHTLTAGHKPPSHKDEIDYACIVEEMTFVHKLMAAFSEISLMHHFSVFPPQSEKQRVSLSVFRHSLNSFTKQLQSSSP